MIRTNKKNRNKTSSSGLSAYCGLECNTCLVHLATIEADPFQQTKMRVEIAEQCSKLYGKNFQAEGITECDGCNANTGRLFSGCFNCEIRKCAVLKNIPNCACCNDYACNELQKLFSLDPDAQKRLEEIRKNNMLLNNEY